MAARKAAVRDARTGRFRPKQKPSRTVTPKAPIAAKRPRKKAPSGQVASPRGSSRERSFAERLASVGGVVGWEKRIGLGQVDAPGRTQVRPKKQHASKTAYPAKGAKKTKKTSKKRRVVTGPRGQKGRAVNPAKVKGKGRKDVGRALASIGGSGGALGETPEGKRVLYEKLDLVKQGLALVKKGQEAWVRQDMTPAIMRSDLRHREGAASLLSDLERITGMRGEAFFHALRQHAMTHGTTVRQAYQDARDIGDGVFSERFKRIAQRLAGAYEVPIREVYTLWFSP